MDALARFNLRNKKVVNAILPLNGDNDDSVASSAKGRTDVASCLSLPSNGPLSPLSSGNRSEMSGASEAVSDCEDTVEEGTSLQIEDLPLELLEVVFAQLKQSIVRSRISKKTGKAHRLGKEDIQTFLAVCGVSRRWRDAGHRVMYQRPWELNLLSGFCYQHPNQMFVKSPMPPLGSRSGLFKCFVRRERGTGRAAGSVVLTMFSGKYQSSKVGFMLSAVSKGRSSYHVYLERASSALEKGVEPCARLECNLLCTKYTLRLSDGIVHALAGGVGVRDYREAVPDGIMEEMGRFGIEEGMQLTERLRERDAQDVQQDDQEAEEVGEERRVGIREGIRAGGREWGQERQQRNEQRERQQGGEYQDGLDIRASVSSERNTTTGEVNAKTALKLHYKARVRGIMQPRRMEVCSIDGDKLQNKPPHWNTGLNCWCLNFHGRVKLASVKNFQLVQEGAGLGMDDPISMQFGKIEEDVFVLDFNPAILSPIQAFGVALSTFNGRII